MFRIFLDIDGVMADWLGGVCKLLSIDDSDETVRQTIMNDGLQAIVSKKDMWKAVDKAGEDWWASLQLFSWSRDLWNYCRDLSNGEVYFLTAPSHRSSCLAGKHTWIRRNFKTDRFVITSHKHLCATQNSVLIDDRENKVNSFTEAGGTGLLFPHHYLISDFAEIKELMNNAIT